MAEGTAQEILDQSLDPLGLPRLQSDALIDAESGVAPTTDIGHDLLGDFPFGQEQIEHRLRATHRQANWQCGTGAQTS